MLVKHHLPVYADDVNILAGKLEKNAGVLVVATKETGLEVNAVKTTYMVMQD
jgi:hypothetical protein